MKKIYIILTHTGTVLSKIIKKYTKDEFSHVSIALDEELQQMYSFGRINPYNPFWAGFVYEHIDKGTFKRFYRTRARIYSLEVTDEQYKNIKENIEQIQKGNYKFNILGLFAVGFNKRIKGTHSFYCAEFVKYVLENAKIDTNLPEIVRPENFKELENIQDIYIGPLKYYKVPSTNKVDLLRTNLSMYTKKQSIV